MSNRAEETRLLPSGGKQWETMVRGKQWCHPSVANAEQWWCGTMGNNGAGTMVPSVGCQTDEHSVEFAECGLLLVAGLE